MSLHPAAEEMEITATGQGRTAATAKTSTVGPGYHIYLCDLLKTLGDAVGIDWDGPDEDKGTRATRRATSTTATPRRSRPSSSSG